jgi:hypothetical protein
MTEPSKRKPIYPKLQFWAVEEPYVPGVWLGWVELNSSFSTCWHLGLTSSLETYPPHSFVKGWHLSRDDTGTCLWHQFPLLTLPFLREGEGECWVEELTILSISTVVLYSWIMSFLFILFQQHSLRSLLDWLPMSEIWQAYLRGSLQRLEQGKHQVAWGSVAHFSPTLCPSTPFPTWHVPTDNIRIFHSFPQLPVIKGV